MDFYTFYAASYDRVRRAMALAFRDPPFAEEVAQEAFLEMLRRWDRVSLLDHPEGYAMVIALNRGRDARRRAARPTAVDAHAWAPSHDARVEDRMEIEELLTSLTDRQREALILRYISQLSVDEIATVMGCAPGTVKATIHAALAKANLTAKDHFDALD